jgi:hypothetical protein
MTLQLPDGTELTGAERAVIRRFLVVRSTVDISCMLSSSGIRRRLRVIASCRSQRRLAWAFGLTDDLIDE